MALFGRKKKPAKLDYDPAVSQPAVRRSICTGEMTLGFLDRETGKFHDYMLARSPAELEEFCAAAGIAPEELKTIY